MNARTETNREKLLNLAIYDLLVSMQGELDYAKEHGEPYPCIMDALGENLPGLRCCSITATAEPALPAGSQNLAYNLLRIFQGILVLRKPRRIAVFLLAGNLLILQTRIMRIALA